MDTRTIKAINADDTDWGGDTDIQKIEILINSNENWLSDEELNIFQSQEPINATTVTELHFSSDTNLIMDSLHINLESSDLNVINDVMGIDQKKQTLRLFSINGRDDEDQKQENTD